MGGSLSKEYAISPKKRTFSLGSLPVWEIYDGTRHSTHEEVSILNQYPLGEGQALMLKMFNKKEVSRLPKEKREEFLLYLRNDVTALSTHLHPNILRVLDKPIETKKEMVAVVDRIGTTLAEVLEKRTTLDPLDVQMGSYQIASALHFLHQNAEVHNAVTPSSIVITATGDWKLCGFSFMGSPPVVNPPRNNSILKDHIKPYFLISDGLGSPTNDVRQLAACIVASFAPEVASMKAVNDPLTALQSHVTIAPELVALLQTMFSGLSTAEVMKDPYYSSLTFRALRYIATIDQRDSVNKAQFFKGLLQVIPKLSEDVFIRRVLPVLEEASWNQMPFILPLVFKAMECFPSDKATESMWNVLYNAADVKDPLDVRLSLLRHFNVMVDKFPVKISMMTTKLLIPALKSDQPELSIEALDQVTKNKDNWEPSTVKGGLLPTVLDVLAKPSATTVMLVRCLDALAALTTHLDQESVCLVFPVLLKVNAAVTSNVASLGADVLMSTVELSLQCSKVASRAKILTHLIPVISPIIAAPKLTSDQAQYVLSTLSQLVTQVSSATEVITKGSQNAEVARMATPKDFKQFSDLVGSDVNATEFLASPHEDDFVASPAAATDEKKTLDHFDDLFSAPIAPEKFPVAIPKEPTPPPQEEKKPEEEKVDPYAVFASIPVHTKEAKEAPAPQEVDLFTASVSEKKGFDIVPPAAPKTAPQEPDLFAFASEDHQTSLKAANTDPFSAISPKSATPNPFGDDSFSPLQPISSVNRGEQASDPFSTNVFAPSPPAPQDDLLGPQNDLFSQPQEDPSGQAQPQTTSKPEPISFEGLFVTSQFETTQPSVPLSEHPKDDSQFSEIKPEPVQQPVPVQSSDLFSGFLVPEPSPHTSSSPIVPEQVDLFAVPAQPEVPATQSQPEHTDLFAQSNPSQPLSDLFSQSRNQPDAFPPLASQAADLFSQQPAPQATDLFSQHQSKPQTDLFASQPQHQEDLFAPKAKATSDNDALETASSNEAVSKAPSISSSDKYVNPLDVAASQPEDNSSHTQVPVKSHDKSFDWLTF